MGANVFGVKRHWQSQSGQPKRPTGGSHRHNLPTITCHLSTSARRAQPSVPRRLHKRKGARSLRALRLASAYKYSFATRAVSLNKISDSAAHCSYGLGGIRFYRFHRYEPKLARRPTDQRQRERLRSLIASWQPVLDKLQNHINLDSCYLVGKSNRSL